MEIKYMIKDGILFIYIFGELDECSASKAKTMSSTQIPQSSLISKRLGSLPKIWDNFCIEQ